MKKKVLALLLFLALPLTATAENLSPFTRGGGVDGASDQDITGQWTFGSEVLGPELPAASLAEDKQWAFDPATGRLNWINSTGGNIWYFQATDSGSGPSPTYTLTVDMVDGNGTDLFTYNLTDYTTDQAFSGLTADSNFTLTPDTGRQGSCTGTGLPGTGNGPYTAGTLTADVTATCTYSATGGISCDPGTDYLGLNTTPTNSGAMISSRLYVTEYTPTCVSGCTSGTFTTPYMYNFDSDADTAKVCVYEDDGDSIPNVGDTIVECAAVSSAAPGFATGPDMSAAVDCSATYWVGLITDSDWNSGYNATGTAYFQGGLDYANPPATLSGTWTTLSGRNYGAYVELGP